MYVRDAQGNITYDKASGKKMYDFGDGASTSATRNWMSMANPIGTLIYDKEEYNMDIFEGNWFAKVDLTHGFTATARLGLNVDNTINLAIVTLSMVRVAVMVVRYQIPSLVQLL